MHTALPPAHSHTTRRTARALSLAFASIAALLLLLGCTGDDDGSDGAVDDGATPVVTSADDEATPATTPSPSPSPTPTAPEEIAGDDPDDETGALLHVTFLDIGQGDATLLQTPDATVLIDTGRHDRSDLVPHLEALEVSEIDVIAITHAHADHIGQLDRALEAFPIAEVWMSGTPHTTQTYDRAVTAIEDSDALYEEPRAGESTEVGSLTIDILHPVELTDDLHEDTLAMRVTYGDVRFLFTGDAERPTECELVERDATLLEAEIYHAGHHGSRTSTSPDFLNAVSPAVTVYSASEGNSYGHPHAEVVLRLAGAGVDIYGTPVHGSVTITTDGATWEVSSDTGAGPLAPADLLDEDELDATPTAPTSCPGARSHQPAPASPTSEVLTRAR